MAYRFLADYATKIFGKATVFKVAFNWSPMYSRSTGIIRSVSDDLRQVEIAIPLSYRNANYVGSIFGGSMLSATDPILMVQLINILGKDYVVWDKHVEMTFKKPTRETIVSKFVWSEEELEEIQTAVKEKGELDYKKEIILQTEKEGSVVAVCTKTLYIADKQFFRTKQAAKKEQGANTEKKVD